MSPLMSLMKIGTPAADSCSAMTCSDFVLPVPVAPATRPCRFSMASGMPHPRLGDGVPSLHAGAQLDGRPVEAVAGGDGLLESLLWHGLGARGYQLVAVTRWTSPIDSSQRSASIAALQPSPAAVTAWR